MAVALHLIITHPCFRCRFPVEVLLGDHVVLNNEKTGHVRYLGHVDGVGQSDAVFVGVELDAPGGFLF